MQAAGEDHLSDERLNRIINLSNLAFLIRMGNSQLPFYNLPMGSSNTGLCQSNKAQLAKFKCDGQLADK
jgi:hypothetical protein